MIEKSTKQLGQMLVEAGIITEVQLGKALENQQKEGGTVGNNLIRLKFVTEETISAFLGKQYGIGSIDLSHYDFNKNILKLISAEAAQKYLVIPLEKKGNVLSVAIANPKNMFAIDDLKFMTGCEISPLVSSETAIRKVIENFYASSGAMEEVLKDMDKEKGEGGELEVVEEEEEVDVNKLKEAVEEAPVVKLVNSILSDAVAKGASDIHIEPYEQVFRVRFRIDGVLYEVMQPPYRLKNAITSRLKIMAELDIAERRLPQDGRIKLKLKNKSIDLRVSTLPTLFGEKIVMRILDKSSLMLDLTHLGFEEKELKDFEKGIHSPYGMVLVTGPTGSGKTTTLYSALDTINSITTNIMTAEDPVEYNLKGINQVHMKEDIGLTFAAALRSFLRQDPNIVMVGEIRDFETADIAIKAALTGHLVLSTLHTNDAPSTINRLINMGIEPFLVASATVLILAQRLIRKICPECKEEVKFPEKALLDLGITAEEIKNTVFYKGRGKDCPNCNGRGYRGRLAIYEVMPISEEIKELILNKASAIEIRDLAKKQGMNTLRDSALIKFKKGMTSIEEVVRVTFGGH
ncbi:MAG: type IV-A pilus assembly ATPase PilB [bacterium]|nr:type IV-A pilus assembly ATPase PilB [bacterium]